MGEIIVTHVKPGETLSGIAARYGVSVDGLQRWNRIENPDLVLAGQKIVVYNAADMAGSSVSESSELRTKSDFQTENDSQGVVFGGAIVLGILFLLLLLRRTRREAPAISRAPSPRHPQAESFRETPVAEDHGNSLQDAWPAPAADPPPVPQVNDGERASSELRRRYRDWILIDNIMLPSGQGTTQIDHILVSPSGVFLIETKDMNGWVFGGPATRIGRNRMQQVAALVKPESSQSSSNSTTRYGKTRATPNPLSDWKLLTVGYFDQS